jgi:group I intron endonuclease
MNVMNTVKEKLSKQITLRNGIEISVQYFDKVTGKKAIYIIVNSKNNKVYVGSSIDISKRRSRHFKALEKNEHENKHLQNAYNKYGKNYFTMYLLEYVENEVDLLQREQFWIDKTCVFDKNIGYNNSPTAGNSIGVKHSEESKRKRSERISGNGNPFYGKKHSKESLKLMSDNSSKAIFQYDLDGNLVKEWIGATEVENTLGYSRNCIYQVCHHRSKQHKGYIWVFKEEVISEGFNIKALIPKPYTKNYKPIYQYDLDGNLIKEWVNITSAVKELNLNMQRIIMCCKGELKSYKGYIFKYKLT